MALPSNERFVDLALPNNGRTDSEADSDLDELQRHTNQSISAKKQKSMSKVSKQVSKCGLITFVAPLKATQPAHSNNTVTRPKLHARSQGEGSEHSNNTVTGPKLHARSQGEGAEHSNNTVTGPKLHARSQGEGQSIPITL